MISRFLNLAVAVVLIVVLSGNVEGRRYKRIRDFLPGGSESDRGAPTEATYLTIGSEMMAAEAGEGGFAPLFVFATIPGGEVDTTYNDTVDLFIYESIDNSSAKIYPGFIPDTTAPQTSVGLLDGEAMVWVQDNEEEELILIGVPRDTLKPTIPCVVTIVPSGDSATQLLIAGNEEINAGQEVPYRYLIKATDDAGFIVPSYTGFVDPTKRAIITVSESNPNGSANLIDYYEGQSGSSISAYLRSGMANILLYDTEPETLTLVATTLLAQLKPDTLVVEVLPPEQVINLFLFSMSGSFGTVSVEKNIMALAFNFAAQAPDPSNNSSEVELEIVDLIGAQSASVFPSTPKTMISGIAQFKLLDTEPDSGVIVRGVASGTPKLYPFFADKIVYGFKPPGQAITTRMSSPTTCVVGDTSTLTIFATDGSDSLDTSYNGWVVMDIDEENPNGSASLLEYPTGDPQDLVHINNGVGRVRLTNNEAEDIQVRLNDAEGNFPFGAYLGNQTPGEAITIHFEPPGGSATEWEVDLPPRGTVGITQTGTLKAVDNSGYVDTAFVDTAKLSSTGNAILSDSIVPIVNGIATFTIVDDSVEEVIVVAQNGGLTPGEDTIAFALRGTAAYLATVPPGEFLVNSELEVALLAVSPEFELDETWSGIAKLTITDPGAASVTALIGDLDSIPIVSGAGHITLIDTEVEQIELQAEWVSGDPPLESFPSERAESEVLLVVALPNSTSVGSVDTIFFETLDGRDSLFPYTTWVGLHWEEGNPNGSVGFTGLVDSVPLIDGEGSIGIQNSEEEIVALWVYTDDQFVANGETFLGEICFYSVQVDEIRATGTLVHSLSNCRPNPFAKSTHITYAIGGKEATPITLRVYDAAGRIVRTLTDGYVSPGFYRVCWNGTDDRGSRVASGLYFYRLELPQKVLTHKTILLR